jgi:hypothetical protein
MRIYSAMLTGATAPLSLCDLTTGRGTEGSFAAGVSLAPLGRDVARFTEIVVFAMLLALIAFPAPARAQTFTMSSVAAAPATVQPGKTVIFTDTITANQNASNYNFAFSLLAPGGNDIAQQFFTVTSKAGVPVTEAYSWTVPASAQPGTYTIEAAVFNPAWNQLLGEQRTALTVAAATAGSPAVYPTLLEFPVISGTAQVGDVLTSTTGTWTGATSFAYQWSGNKMPIGGATGATYTPVSGDAGHTLTSTVVATGSPGATSSATSGATVPIVAASPGSPPASASGSTPFAALHTYYMSPTGSDSNNGTSAASAWATPNHAVNCGDVIIAATGAYTTKNISTSPSNCPSTAGGIDGTGGVYFASVVCATSFGCSGAWGVSANNWAVEGWVCNGNGTTRCYMANATASGTTIYHHIAFVNDVAYNSTQGFGMNEGALNHNAPGNGIDYWAIIGDIAQNAAQDGICLGAIDAVAPTFFNTNTGTHIYLYGNISFANVNPKCQSSYDTEDYMFDTWDAHGVNYQGVIANNIGYDAIRPCIQMTEQTYSADAPTIKIYNNTCFQNNTNNGTDWMDGEINLGIPSKSSWIFTIVNNIAYQPLAKSGGGGGVSAMVVGNPTTITNGGSGTQNILRANNTTCKASKCNSTFDEQAFNGAAIGTNTYTNPSFVNTADLLANRVGTPSCSGFTNSTACMGWNASTSRLTTPSVISDLIATAVGSAPYYSAVAGKGYQLPSTTCAPNADYPTWLKGIVYLQWNGAALTENAGLVNKPCGL